MAEHHQIFRVNCVAELRVVVYVRFYEWRRFHTNQSKFNQSYL